MQTSGQITTLHVMAVSTVTTTAPSHYSIFIGSVPYNLNVTDMRSILEEQISSPKSLLSVYLQRDPNGVHAHNGVCFVDVKDKEDAFLLVDTLNGRSVESEYFLFCFYFCDDSCAARGPDGVVKRRTLKVSISKHSILNFIHEDVVRHRAQQAAGKRGDCKNAKLPPVVPKPSQKHQKKSKQEKNHKYQQHPKTEHETVIQSQTMEESKVSIEPVEIENKNVEKGDEEKELSSLDTTPVANVPNPSSSSSSSGPAEANLLSVSFFVPERDQVPEQDEDDDTRAHTPEEEMFAENALQCLDDDNDDVVDTPEPTYQFHANVHHPQSAATEHPEEEPEEYQHPYLPIPPMPPLMMSRHPSLLAPPPPPPPPSISFCGPPLIQIRPPPPGFFFKFATPKSQNHKRGGRSRRRPILPDIISRYAPNKMDAIGTLLTAWSYQRAHQPTQFTQHVEDQFLQHVKTVLQHPPGLMPIDLVSLLPHNVLLPHTIVPLVAL
jgi:hypothetical protein